MRSAWIFALALLSALPVVLAHYPAMLDYPAHLARWHVMLHSAGSPDLQRFYTFSWAWIPNLGADLLIRPLAAVFGLETGGRIIAGLAPVLLGLGFIATDRTLHGRVGVGSLLALTTVWAPSLLMGFLNFTLAEGLAFLGFALWVKLQGKPARAPLFLAYAPLVWVCHLAGWGVLGVLVFGHEWARRPGLGGILRAGLATWPLWPPAALTILVAGGRSVAAGYTVAELQAKAFYWIIGLRDVIPLIDMATVAVLVFAIMLGLRRGRIDPRIGVGALLLAVLVFLVPRDLGGGDFADMRLVPVALAAGVLSLDIAASPRLLALAALPFCVRLGVTSADWVARSRETQALLGALDHIPRGGIVAGAWAYSPADWHQSPHGHVFAWATVRRDALTNAHFAIRGVHALQLAIPDPEFIDPSQRIVLLPGVRPDLSAFSPAVKAQFLWYVGDRPPSRLPSGATIVWRSGDALLARLPDAPVGATRR